MKLKNAIGAAIIAISSLGAGNAKAATLGVGDSLSWIGSGSFSYLSAQIDIAVNAVLNGIFDLTVTVWNLTNPAVNNNPEGNRLSVFGFDTAPNILSATIDQGWQLATNSNGISSGLEACFKESGNNNCNNGQNGIFAGTSLTFNIDLATDDPTATEISFDRVWVRYQSVGEGDDTSESDNFNLTPVPLPAAGWLFLVGLGSLMAIRRRKAV